MALYPVQTETITLAVSFSEVSAPLTCKPLPNGRYGVYLLLPSMFVKMHEGRSKYANHTDMFEITASRVPNRPKDIIVLFQAKAHALLEKLQNGENIPFRKEIIKTLCQTYDDQNSNYTRYQTLTFKQFLKEQKHKSNLNLSPLLTEFQKNTLNWMKQIETNPVVVKIRKPNNKMELIEGELLFDVSTRSFMKSSLVKKEAEEVIEIPLRGACLFAQHGYGKTRIVSALCETKCKTEDDQIRPTIILCPNHTCQHWLNEIKLLHPDATCFILTSKRQYENLFKQQPYDFYIVAHQFIDNYHYQKDIHGYIYGNTSEYTIYNYYYNSDESMYKILKNEGQFNHGGFRFFAFHCKLWNRVVVDEAHGISQTVVDFVKYLTSETVWCLSASPFADQNSYSKYLEMLLANPIQDDKYGYKSNFISQFLDNACCWYSLPQSQLKVTKTNITVDYEENERLLYQSIIERWDHASQYSASEICSLPYLYYDKLAKDINSKNLFYDFDELSSVITARTQRYFHNSLKYLKQSLDNLETDFCGQECLICRQNLHYDMTLLVCGHFFCITCYDHWFQRHQQCPICRTQIQVSHKYHYLRKMSANHIPKYGSKIIKVVENVRQKIFNEKERVIVFSRSDKLISKIQNLLSANKIPHGRFYGNSSMKQKALRTFENIACLLVSSQTSLDGLVINSCSCIIFVDGHCAYQFESEMQQEEQKMVDKMFNITQNGKTVRAYRYFISNTVDKDFNVE